MKHNPQSGNALWFILIAIVLLGGLTVMMSRSSGTSEDSGDYERSQIQVSEVARYMKSIEMAVQTLRNNGCSEKDINFDTPMVAGYNNTTAPADDSCDVFSVKGGGMTYKRIPPVLLDTTKSANPLYGHWIFNGGNLVYGLGTGTSMAGTKDQDLLIIAPFLTKDFCMKLNKFVGVNNVGVDPPKEDNTTTARLTMQFTGTFGGGTDIDGNGNALGLNTFRRKSSGCTTASNETAYYFYQVLITR
jgi:hypothetical protein